jgi:hypothetical protein
VLIFTRYYRDDEANDGLDGWIENVGEIEMTAKYKCRNPKRKSYLS